jgi:predicted naringenin-chalcone synthase
MVLCDREDSIEGLEAFFPVGVSPPTAERLRVFERLAPLWAERAARAALADAGVESLEVTHLVTVSCTGVVSPGVDAALIEALGLRRDVERVNIGFMGCHAAINALMVARRVAMSDASARVLVVCVELCSLHLGYGWNLDRVIANALFSDGAGACVVGAAVGRSDRKSMARIVGGSSWLVPDSSSDMAWRVGERGFEMTLSARVPGRVGAGVRAWCEGWLDRYGLGVEAVRHWAVHPGGPKVLDATASGLGLSEDRLEVSRRVLRDVGNVSSVTVILILERMLRAGLRGPCVAMAFGPGLMMEGLLVELGAS